MPVQCFDLYVPDISVALSACRAPSLCSRDDPLNMKSTVIPLELDLAFEIAACAGR